MIILIKKILLFFVICLIFFLIGCNNCLFMIIVEDIIDFVIYISFFFKMDKVE